jgi:hypothetical protein
MISGNPSLDQLLGNTVFSPIPLNPYFPIDNIKMDNAPMDASRTVPPNGEQEIMVCLPIHDHFYLNLAMGIGYLGVRVQHFGNALPIGF